MIIITRFDSFDAIQPHWIELENKTDHYPFQAFWYQRLFAKMFCKQENVYLLGVFDNKTLLAIGVFEQVAEKMLFLGMKQVLGGQDVTDYGDLLLSNNLSNEQVKEIWQAVLAYFKDQGNAQLQLDFVREDSKAFGAFHEDDEKRDSKVLIEKQEVAPFLPVPHSWEEYLQSLSRKDRHELKRKIKRFEEQQAFHVCSTETLAKDFEDFVRLHRLSDSAKEKFMSEEMKQFFWNLVQAEKEDYRIDFCYLNIDNKCVASIMSFIGQGKALVYNSGFDPEYSYYSVGLILHAYLIKKSIEAKLQIHDFLRGSERYKYDLGAKDMQLYKIKVAK